jgi:predicted kinase
MPAAGRLIVICGLPGAGKTTYARRLEAELGAIRFCPDEWMQALGISLWDEKFRAALEALQWQLGQQLLPYGLTIIIEWGTWGRSERDTLRLRARELGARVELHYLTAPLDELFARLQQRRMEEPPITRDQLLQYANIFQAPTTEEMALFDDSRTLSPE